MFNLTFNYKTKMKPIFIIVLALSQISASEFRCNYFFKDTFQLFGMPKRESKLELRFKMDNYDGDKDVETAYIYIKECGNLIKNDVCGNADDMPINTKAAIKVDSKRDCVFITSEGEWSNLITTADDGQTLIQIEQAQKEATSENKNFSLVYHYICSPNGEQVREAVFLPHERQVILVNTGSDSCAYTFETLKLITENRYIVLTFLGLIGSLLCFMGIKFFKDLFYYFLGLVVIIFGVYLCSFIFAPSMEPEMVNKYLKMAIVLTLIVLAIVLLVKFTWFLVAVLSLIASYFAARILIEALKQFNEKVFTNQYFFYALFAVIFIVLFLIHQKFSDHFVILCSGLIGGFMLSAALMNLVNKNWEFLFTLTDLGQDINFDKVLEKKFIVLGIIFSLIGICAQFLFFKMKKNNETTHPKDLRIELKGV